MAYPRPVVPLIKPLEQSTEGESQVASANSTIWLACLLMIPFGCCLQITKRQKLDQKLGSFLPENAAFEGRYVVQAPDSAIEQSLSVVLFDDGSILSTSFLTFQKDNPVIEHAKRLNIYRDASFRWGKYYIVGDTIHIEHVRDVSGGGGGFCKMRPLRYKGLIRDNQLRVFPGPEKKYGDTASQYIYPREGILCEFKGPVPRSFIDPSKARINQ